MSRGARVSSSSMRAIACLLLCAMAGCASSSPVQCDPQSGTCVDAAVDPTPDGPPDAPPGAGFGEPCTDNHQCESGICILVGTSGQCTQLCGQCPSGYG